MNTQQNLKMFPPANLPKEDEKHDEAFENLIQEFLNRTKAEEKRKFIYSDILRQLGKNLWYDQSPELHNAKALFLAKECYMNALSIYANKNVATELNILLTSKLIEDKRIRFLNLTCKQQGAENFFSDAIRSYRKQISELFPEQKNQVLELLTVKQKRSKLGN